MTIAQKLRALLEIKEQIRQSIINRGVSITENTPFSEYSNKIRDIEIVDKIAPMVLSCDVSEDGLVVNILCSEFIFKENLILTLSIDGVDVGYTASINGERLTLVPNKAIYQNNAVIIAYVSGVEDKARNQLASFTMSAINHSKLNKIDAALAVFGVNDRGVYYDFDDLTTLYQDAQLTTNLTAVGQTIAGFRDKSGKGWNCVQSTVGRQTKLGKSDATNAHFIQFDRQDDSIDQIIGSNFDTSRGITIIVATDYKAANTTGYLHVGLYQSGSWGFAIKANTNILSSGISTATTDVASDRNWNISVSNKFIDASMPSKDCFILTMSGNQFAKLQGNNGLNLQSSIMPVSWSWNMSNFYFGVNNRHLYKLLVINRVLSDEECVAIRTQFNEALGV